MPSSAEATCWLRLSSVRGKTEQFPCATGLGSAGRLAAASGSRLAHIAGDVFVPRRLHDAFGG